MHHPKFLTSLVTTWPGSVWFDHSSLTSNQRFFLPTTTISLPHTHHRLLSNVETNIFRCNFILHFYVSLSNVTIIIISPSLPSSPSLCFSFSFYHHPLFMPPLSLTLLHSSIHPFFLPLFPLYLPSHDGPISIKAQNTSITL